MKQDDRDHNADYWASREADPSYVYRHIEVSGDWKAHKRRIAYELAFTNKSVDRIDNLKKLLVRSHAEYKNLVEVCNPPPTGALKNSVKD
jgi:hypothetical protein